MMHQGSNSGSGNDAQKIALFANENTADVYNLPQGNRAKKRRRAKK